MSYLRTFAVLVLVALFLLLPLYEFVDIGEQWPNDGNLVLVVLSALYFVGVSIVGRELTRLCVALRRTRVSSTRCSHAVATARLISHAYASLFLIFCHFRI